VPEKLSRVKRLFSWVKLWRAIGAELRRRRAHRPELLLLTTRETRYKFFTVQAGTPMTVKEIQACHRKVAGFLFSPLRFETVEDRPK
jgi:hypothetical protein